jgi:hypothetical protein
MALQLVNPKNLAHQQDRFKVTTNSLLTFVGQVASLQFPNAMK